MSEPKQIEQQESSESAFSRILRYVVVLAVAVFAVYHFTFSKPVEYAVQETKGKTMGTYYQVKVCDFPKSPKMDDEWKRVADAVQQRLDETDQMMSTFKPDSEVSRFNASESTDWFTVSRETAEVVQTALEVSQLTDGAFDITITPLVDFWGFGAKHGNAVGSTVDAKVIDEKIAEIKHRVGFDKLECRLDPPALKKTIPNLTVDLSAIAKGYAVDRVARLLEEKKFKHFIVEVGGEVRCHGDKGSNNGKRLQWTIAIEKPLLVPAEQFPGTQRKLPVSNLALATSGDYLNYREINGVRYSHLIDPRTGFPMRQRTEEENVGSVSVFDKDCVKADALATALFILGKEKGLELARQKELAVLYLLRTDGQEPLIREIASPSFNKLFPN